MTQLTKSVATAGDAMIQTQVGRNVDTEQTNTAAGNGSVGTKLEKRIPATQRGTAVT